MNENELFNNSTNSYKATRNLNTEIENPQMNINSAVGLNIQAIPETNIQNNDTIDKYFDVNLNHPNQQPTPNNDFQNSNSYNNTNFNNQNFNNSLSIYTFSIRYITFRIFCRRSKQQTSRIKK